MVDRERVLAKLDELQGYLRELRAIQPARFEGFQRIETRRACERLLQIHEYGRIDDRIVYDMATARLVDFEAFQREVLTALGRLNAP